MADWGPQSSGAKRVAGGAQVLCVPNAMMRYRGTPVSLGTMTEDGPFFLIVGKCDGAPTGVVRTYRIELFYKITSAGATEFIIVDNIAIAVAANDSNTHAQELFVPVSIPKNAELFVGCRCSVNNGPGLWIGVSNQYYTPTTPLAIKMNWVVSTDEGFYPVTGVSTPDTYCAWTQLGYSGFEAPYFYVGASILSHVSGSEQIYTWEIGIGNKMGEAGGGAIAAGVVYESAITGGTYPQWFGPYPYPVSNYVLARGAPIFYARWKHTGSNLPTFGFNVNSVLI